MTTAEDLRRHGPSMLCVSQGEVSRVTTLSTSGTSGQLKRIFFSSDDLERTVDFFHHGMNTFTQASQRVLVLMPGEQPHSIGNLLRKAMPRMDCEAVIHGLAGDSQADQSEVVITTLTAQAMPRLRYRTRDLADLLPGSCPCGCRLPRLGPIQGRLRDQVRIDDKQTISMAELDEILLDLPWLINYRAALHRDDHGWLLDLEISTFNTPTMQPDGPEETRHVVEAALAGAGVLEHGLLRLVTCTWGASIDRSISSAVRSNAVCTLNLS